MEYIIPTVKYIFVVAAGVEAILILRALYQLAREKAQTTVAAPAAEE
ncbi:MAG: hypothetical protein JST60_16660 [Chloroflexi bacterium SZAS-1]|jgi:hypothetical protein|nr:hypothetical protein [Chloroflexi bacterium SZAS-1]HNP86876.1 hypothetical protein [Kouleothrix sp.]